MAKAKDLTGQVFGRLTVISLNEEESNVLRPSGKRMVKAKHYNCQCECGNTCVVRANLLTQGKTTSCGCLRKETCRKQGQKNTIDLTGQKFDRLTVVQVTNKRAKDNEIIWLCQCDCGSFKEVKTSALTSGKVRSCGCLATEVAQGKLAKVNEYQRGKLHPSWQGKAEIKEWLAKSVQLWKQDMLRYFNYTCDITGQRGGRLNVHHLKGLNTIIDEAHIKNNIVFKDLVVDYTQEELDILLDYVKSQHTLEEGVVLCEEVHRLFHKNYGYGNNTPEQYEEFKQRYFNGEFNSDELDSTTNVA